jgi:hypothetical protein
MNIHSRRRAVLVTLSLAVLAAASALVLGGRGLTTPQYGADEEEIATRLREFWAAARATNLETDEASRGEYLTKASEDFIRKCNKSNPPPTPDPEEVAAAAADGAVLLRAHALSSNEVSAQWMMLKRWAGLIHKNQYELRRVLVQRLQGDEAVVYVRYGNEKYPYDGAHLLLHKEEGRWNIFMDADNSILDTYCRTFAGGNK